MHHSVANDPTGIILDIRSPKTGAIAVPFRNGLLTVRLPENATTGHTWQVENCTHGLSFLGDRRDPDPAARPGLVGGGATRALVFRAHKAGKVSLELRRPWEKAPAIVLEIALQD